MPCLLTQWACKCRNLLRTSAPPRAGFFVAPSIGGGRCLEKSLSWGSCFQARTAMVCLSEGMTLTTQLKPMTTSNITSNNKTGIKQAASLVAMAVAPLAIVIGVAAMSVPSAEAGYTQCIRTGQLVQCWTTSY